MRGHLIRRNGTYLFRRRVPKGLAAKVGKSEICKNPETRFSREAWLRSNHARTAIHENRPGSADATVCLKRISIQNLKKAAELIDYADDVKALLREAKLT
jgi:hypothetical protein